ncbi:hypothetical protein PCE1_004578 [Barthelona sp. PCE]
MRDLTETFMMLTNGTTVQPRAPSHYRDYDIQTQFMSVASPILIDLISIEHAFEENKELLYSSNVLGKEMLYLTTKFSQSLTDLQELHSTIIFRAQTISTFCNGVCQCLASRLTDLNTKMDECRRVRILTIRDNHIPMKNTSPSYASGNDSNSAGLQKQNQEMVQMHVSIQESVVKTERSMNEISEMMQAMMNELASQQDDIYQVVTNTDQVENTFEEAIDYLSDALKSSSWSKSFLAKFFLVLTMIIWMYHFLHD